MSGADPKPFLESPLRRQDGVHSDLPQLLFRLLGQMGVACIVEAFELTRVLLSIPPCAPKSGLMTAKRAGERILANSVVPDWAAEPTGWRSSVEACSSRANPAVGHVLQQPCRSRGEWLGSSTLPENSANGA